MFEQWRSPFKRLIEPVAKTLVSMHVTANMVTMFGSLGTVVVALITGLTGHLFAGALVLTVLVIFDSLDGSVAALTTGGTQFGAFLDSTLDRIADWAVLVAVIIYFVLHTGVQIVVRTGATGASIAIAPVSLIGIFAALFAIMTSFVTSYARARAQSIGADAKNGIATRSDRLVIILVGMALTGLFNQPWLLVAAMLILDLLGAITVIQRIVFVSDALKPDAFNTHTNNAHASSNSPTNQSSNQHANHYSHFPTNQLSNQSSKR